MSELTLERLRKLRQRAEDLLRFAGHDLHRFLHKEDKETFRRKPESPSITNDVNVTTTCSCLMALSLTNAFRKFYKVDRQEVDAENKACAVFNKLIEAAWMSSGLTANNAFSSTLVIRTFGFMNEEGYLNPAKLERKSWELHLGIREDAVIEFAGYINDRKDDLARFLHSSASEKSRKLLTEEFPAGEGGKAKRKALTTSLALDLQRLIQSGWIYTKDRFPNIGGETLTELDKSPTGYKLATVNHKLFIEQLNDFFTPPSKLTIPEIALRMADAIGNFAINEYSPSATVLYWFVDGLVRGRISLAGDKRWERLCQWATQEFNRERSLVLANHDAMMDPIAMAMAACLCAKLRSLAAKAELGTDKEHREMLPSIVELEHSIKELFKRQTASGIWPKYFPLFHYQDAGSNFCFTFELLEAVLCEFGGADNTLLDQIPFVEGLEKAVTWCERNRLKCSEGSEEYTGWNSGGDIETLKKERPESWATAVVHMFLSELTKVLAQRIQKRVLQKYHARQPKRSVEEVIERIRKEPAWKDKHFGRTLDDLQDIQLYIDGEHEGLIAVLKNELVDANFGKTESKIRRDKAKNPISALLFGPPGTSKTQVTKAIAEDLGWPFVEINPSEFVKGSFANVYLQAEEIFADLQDLAAVVVLFDEMDALTQKRATGGNQSGTNHLDTATQFLTTSMLPKLSALHDKGGAVFFMATNFQENFDPAIKRAGRFDLLLCMGPPTLDEKLAKIDCFFDPPLLVPQRNNAQFLIRQYLVGSQKHANILALFTYGDFKALLKRIGTEANLGDKLQELGKEEFLKRVEGYSETVGLKYKDFLQLGKGDAALDEIDKLSPEEFKAKIENAAIKDTFIGQYLRDRRESKRQF